MCVGRSGGGRRCVVFYQAEDGIRVIGVTGVQTCALPISYDDANPPLPGGWTVFDRIARGDEMVVHGDGTSLWTLTHAEDFAQGFVGLLGNPRAIGEAFHITSDETYTWDQIYTIVAGALGVEAKLVHVPSEMISVAAPDWFWSELLIGDLAHSAVFDNSKLRRYVPSYSPRLTFHRAVLRMVEWRKANPDRTKADPATDAIFDRLVDGYHRAADRKSTRLNSSHANISYA